MQFPTDEQMYLMKLRFLLPFVLHVFQRDKKVIETSSLKTKEPYLALLDQIILRIEREMADNRKGLRGNGIHIFQENKDEGGIEWKYKYKGYEHQSGIVWHVIKSEVEKLMANYLMNGRYKDP